MGNGKGQKDKLYPVLAVKAKINVYHNKIGLNF